MWLLAGAQQVVNNPEKAQHLEDGEQDPDVCQSDGHLVEDHAADEGTAQEHHVDSQQPREELPSLLRLPVALLQRRAVTVQPQLLIVDPGAVCWG